MEGDWPLIPHFPPKSIPLFISLTSNYLTWHLPNLLCTPHFNGQYLHTTTEPETTFTKQMHYLSSENQVPFPSPFFLSHNLFSIPGAKICLFFITKNPASPSFKISLSPLQLSFLSQLSKSIYLALRHYLLSHLCLSHSTLPHFPGLNPLHFANLSLSIRESSMCLHWPSRYSLVSLTILTSHFFSSLWFKSSLSERSCLCHTLKDPVPRPR